MKRNLEQNLLISIFGLFLFWAAQISYTVCKVGFGYDLPIIYFLGQALSYVFICFGLMSIAKKNKVLYNILFSFFLLAIANLGDEITYEALNVNMKEVWYASAICGYLLHKTFSTREHI